MHMISRLALSRVVSLAIGSCLLAAGCSSLSAQMTATAPAAPKVGSQAQPSVVYEKLLSGMESEFVSAAEAMPEDKYNFAPTAGEFKGARTFSQQLKHVIEANDYYFRDPNAPAPTNEAAIEKLATKAEIVAELKAGFARAHAYIQTITAENAFEVTKHGTRAGNTAMGIAHFMDHYGQLALYLRMNGVVPPASRGKGM